MTGFLEQYVVEHGRLPSGVVDVDFLTNGTHWQMGEYDFDELLAEAGVIGVPKPTR